MMKSFALLSLMASAASGSIISEQMDAYKKLIGSDVLTKEGLMTILKYHDSDTKCHGPCEKWIFDKWGMGDDGIAFDKLADLLHAIYGDAISSDPLDPQEVHLSLTDSLSDMKVMYVTMDPLLHPFVEYTSSDNEWTDATTLKSPATSDTYTVPQNWYPVFAGVIYTADMTHLIPGKHSYKYRVGGLDAAGNVHRSQDFSFVTAPVPSAHQKTTFAMLGDQGTFMVLGFAVSDKIIALKDELGIDLVHYAGDLSYAGLSGDLTPKNGVEEDDEFGHIWDLWGIQNEPISATVPLMTTPGNHESFYNYTAFNHRYKMPASPGSNNNYWFSYDYGNVHVVSISTEEDFAVGSPQMLWIEQDLIAATANRHTVPWIVLSMHRPMYCSEKGNNNASPRTTNVEPLLIKYDVDLVIQGHIHAYERTHPVVQGTVSSFPKHRPNGDGHLVDVYESEGKGPVYVVQGNTGAMQFETWEQPQPEWSAIRFANGFIPPHNPFRGKALGDNELGGPILRSNYTDTFGFGVSTFHNATHLHYQNIPITGHVGVDEFWVVKRQKL